jgi:hypothetical protein
VRNRPDVEVITKRKLLGARTPEAVVSRKAAAVGVGQSHVGIVAGRRLPLRVTAAPFAVPGSDAAVVAISLGIRQPAFAGRTPDQIELMLRSFTTTGRSEGRRRSGHSDYGPAAPLESEVSRYEVLARLDVLKPGPYHLRLSAHSVASDTRASVYVDVEVPDFKKDKSRSPASAQLGTWRRPRGPAAAPARHRAGHAHHRTLLRHRRHRHRPSCASIRAPAKKVASVPLKVTIQDAAGKSVFNKTETWRRTVLGRARSRLPVPTAGGPLATLKTGDYLLTFEAPMGKATARRDVRFSVK